MIIGIGSLLICVSISNAEISKQDVENVERQVLQQTQKQKKLEKEAEKIASDLQKVNQEMIEAAKMIQNNEETISQMEDRLKLLEVDYKKVQDNLLKQDLNLVKTISALQSLALKPTEALFVHPLSPVDIVRSAMLLRETVPYLETQAELIKQELKLLDDKRVVIVRQVRKIEKQKAQLEREHAQMRVLADKKSKYRLQVSKQSEQAKRDASKLAGQAKDLRELFDKLEAERIEKERIRRQKAEEAKKQVLASKEKQYNSLDLMKFGSEDINEVGKAFVKAKGALSRPARGRIITRYGQETSKGVTSKGIIIATRDKAQVIAPFDGNVLFVGPFRGYGNLIIVDHGMGYTSLLAGLDNVDCELGQMLLAGEPVGQMPSGDSARLYVELRKDNRPINPESWIEK